MHIGLLSIRISQVKNNSISVDEARYSTSVVAKYLDTTTIKENSEFHKTTLTHDIKLIKEYLSIIDEKLGVLSIEYNIQYRAYVGS